MIETVVCPMSSSDPVQSEAVIVAAVAKWVEDVEALHAQVQAAMEDLRVQPGLGREAQALIERLLIVLRQRQAQAPTPDMVRTWVRVLAQD